MLDPAVVKVHVVGAVRRPGLYRLAAGARIDDAVEAAGGAAKGADLGGVNLAAPVADGTQIRVPARGEEPVPGDRATPAPGGSGLLPTGPATAQGSDGGTVNLNTADATTLQTLPGIGPALSQRLIEWREQQGPFTSSADLDAVPGIGPAMLAKLEGKVGYG
jgi:competence protein ComEA